VERVYEQATEAIIRHTRDLEILQLAGTYVLKRPCLPSWIPDLGDPQLSGEKDLRVEWMGFDAAADSPFAATFLSTGCVRVRCFRADTCAKVEHAHPTDVTPSSEDAGSERMLDRCRPVLSRWRRLVLDALHNVPEAVAADRFWRLFCIHCNVRFGDVQQREDWLNADAYQNTRNVYVLADRLSGASCFITSSLRFGFAPRSSIAVDDELVILAGCSRPVFVQSRPSAHGPDSHFQLIGACVCEGAYQSAASGPYQLLTLAIGLIVRRTNESQSGTNPRS